MSATKVSNLRPTAWAGSLPVILCLAPTSLSSPTMPPPLHVMVSRMTYLHVGLRDAVMRMYKFAPAAVAFKKVSEPETGSGTAGDASECDTAEEVNEKNATTDGPGEGEEPYPVCWFEDEDTSMALRWHLFAGVLYDLIKRRRRSDSYGSNLPWKIRVHFSSYPTHQILQIDSSENSANGILSTVERTFNNSLKQALFLQHGNSKVAMSMTKLSHKKLWDAVVRSNYGSYQEVNVDLQAGSFSSEDCAVDLQNVPVRLMVDGRPATQRPCPVLADQRGDYSSVAGGSMKETKTTLGSLLEGWAPNLFQLRPDGSAEAESGETTWRVQGIEPPLSCPVVDLWQTLCHPDHFLYVNVVSRTE